jgi:hypothetical protein
VPNRTSNRAEARPSDIDPLIGGATVGVLGGRWRGTVTPWGAIQQWDAPDRLDWHVAADDRWHTPSAEPTVRQSRLDGTPVIETRLRVPKGDVVHRVFAVADHAGMTLIEVENDSPLPVAVAFSGSPVVSARPPARVPIEGIDLPADAVVFPVGHRAAITVAISHDRSPMVLPGRLPTALQVARGWTATCDRASRLMLPDVGMAEAVTTARCEMLLAGPPLPVDDPVEFLLTVHQLVRMAGGADDWMPDVADAVAALARSSRADVPGPELGVGLDAATAIADHAEDRRAQRDLLKLRGRLVAAEAAGIDQVWMPDPDTVTGARFVTSVERRSAIGGDLLPAGLPPSWLGVNFEVHDIPTFGRSSISYAVRWHGDRPALLWQCNGEPVRLTSSSLAPGWSSDQPSGEALWPAPDMTLPMSMADGEPGSFS